MIAGGIPTEALLAQVAVSKYADGLPLYRQEQIYARDGVELDRSLMAQWMDRLGFELEPLAQYVLHTVKQSERVFADKTRLPTLSPGSGKVKTAWLWAYARDDRPFGGSGPPMVAYRFEDSRSGDCVARHLDGYRGILQVDGYAAYTWLSKQRGDNDAISLAGCWAHARRKFFDRHAADGSPFAAAVLKAMVPLWAVDEDIRGHDAELRASIRAERSHPIVADLFAMFEKELPRLSGKAKLAEAIRYTLTRRARALPCRWPYRDRLQYRRTGNPSADHYAQECTVRRLRWWWQGLGDDCHAAHHGQNERRRPECLADTDPRAHCRRLA